MALKEFSDVDSNELNDVSQPKEQNKFDLSDSDEIAEQLEQEELDGGQDEFAEADGPEPAASQITDAHHIDVEDDIYPEIREETSINADTGQYVDDPETDPDVQKGTIIDDKVVEIEKQKLPNFIADSFADGEYRTVVSTEPITLYRTFGGQADAGGSYATTTPSSSESETRQDLALLPEWGNSCQYEAKITVPEGTILNVGKVAKQIDFSDGTIYKGGGDQVLLPQNWFEEHPDWITDIYVIKEDIND